MGLLLYVYSEMWNGFVVPLQCLIVVGVNYRWNIKKLVWIGSNLRVFVQRTDYEHGIPDHRLGLTKLRDELGPDFRVQRAREYWDSFLQEEAESTSLSSVKVSYR